MALNPQQMAFKEAYCNPMSATFGNAYQSAIAVGYADEYAQTITTQGYAWYSEMLGDQDLLNDAEKALKEAINYDVRNGGEKIDSGVASIKLKAATFAAEGLGKEKYSKRNELTGKGGEQLFGLGSLFEKAKSE